MTHPGLLPGEARPNPKLSRSAWLMFRVLHCAREWRAARIGRGHVAARVAECRLIDAVEMMDEELNQGDDDAAEKRQ